MHIQSLNGTWELSGGDYTLPATVPGCAHTDLRAAGKIEDPFYRDNELDLLWIGETDWTFRRQFDVSDELLTHDHVLLRCYGLDTIATVVVNGIQIAQTDNMHRTYEFDVKTYLQSGDNTIEVTFASAMNYVREREREGGVLPAWGVGHHKLNSGGWIRKQPSNFRWDWGPMLVTAGIWRDIELVAHNEIRLTDVHILQDHTIEGKVSLTVNVTATDDGPVTCQITHKGAIIATTESDLQDGTAELALDIDDPQLWWPAGMGEQPLYTVEVTAGDDLWTGRIGLRTLQLDCHDDEWGESFQFVANGVSFFAKGANWIPADTFVTALTKADYRRLLEDAVAANMNMIRVWGGGIYEYDMFFDICDELGICVWQDFMFACATYPAYDQDFMTNVRAEAEDNVRRIRHHPSLALWCGNNELEQGLVGDEWTDHTMSWEDYGALYDVLLPEVVSVLDPQTAYWPCSPHTPRGDRSYWLDPTAGDVHIWQVWHGRQPFEFYRTCEHRFISEFGFQSFPEPATTHGYTQPTDRNITSFVMEHHQRSAIGNSTIIHYMTDWFRLPTSFDQTLWLSQILQGLGIKYAVEGWRRNMPRQMGALYWQLNDCWPVASWASIDYHGRWKALHYMARRFFAPVLLSAVEDLESNTVDLHITNDKLDPVDGLIRWRLTDLAGHVVDEGRIAVSVAASHTQKVSTLTLNGQVQTHGPRNLILWLDLTIDDEIVSSNLVTFARVKHLELADPGIQMRISVGERNIVTLEAAGPALYVWLSGIDGRFSDNFFHLFPGKPVEIEIDTTETDLENKLVVQSVINTYA